MEAELALRVTAAAATAVFALLLFTSNPKKAANQFLGFFLLLIAANQAAEGVRHLITDPGADLIAFRVASVLASLDPFFLYYFAAIYPERNALWKPSRLAAVGLPAIALAGLSIARVDVPYTIGLSTVTEIGWATYTAIVYTIVLVHMGRQLVRDKGPSPLRLLFPAVAVATLPAWPRVLTVLYRRVLSFSPSIETGALAMLGLYVLLMVGGIAYVVRLIGIHRAVVPQHRQVAWLSLAISFALAVFLYLRYPLDLLEAAGVTDGTMGAGFVPLLALGAGVRWTTFSVLVSLAVLRHELLGMSLAWRRRSARILIALVFMVGAVGVAALVGYGFQAGGLDPRPMDVVVLVLVLIASQGFQSLVDVVAEKLYRVPMPGDLSGAVETYQRAAEQAMEEGRGLDEDDTLDRLREELGIDPRTARVTHRMVRAATTAPLEEGSTIQGRYRIVRLLSHGATGGVFLAEDELLERKVVLKELSGGHQALRTNALEEARVAGGLDHPNVLTLYDVLQRGPSVVLVTEYASGGSLADRLARAGEIDPSEAVDLAAAVLSGLEAIHLEGIVHRDVKPSNILLLADGTPKIADFGIARVRRGITQTFSESGPFTGTPAFMAPEQLRGEIATPETDIYAVGLILKKAIGPNLPETLAPVIRQALADEPEARFASAAEMRHALLEAARAPDLAGIAPA